MGNRRSKGREKQSDPLGPGASTGSSQIHRVHKPKKGVSSVKKEESTSPAPTCPTLKPTFYDVSSVIDLVVGGYYRVKLWRQWPDIDLDFSKSSGKPLHQQLVTKAIGAMRTGYIHDINSIEPGPWYGLDDNNWDGFVPLASLLRSREDIPNHICNGISADVNGTARASILASLKQSTPYNILFVVCKYTRSGLKIVTKAFPDPNASAKNPTLGIYDPNGYAITRSTAPLNARDQLHLQNFLKNILQCNTEAGASNVSRVHRVNHSPLRSVRRSSSRDQFSVGKGKGTSTS